MHSGDDFLNEGIIGVCCGDDCGMFCNHGGVEVDYIVKREVTPYNSGSLFASYVGGLV